MHKAILSAILVLSAGAVSCSGARITDSGGPQVVRSNPGVNERPHLAAFGGTRSPSETPSSWDVPEGLALRSDVTYRPDRFPAPGGLSRLLERVLAEEGVPTEFAALPWIESSYNVACYSSMGAAGPWQFVRETARSFDLRIDSEVDERYSWTSSTRAAARLLRHLHDMFGSWTLALAAYNCGEGLLSRAVCRGDSSFLELDLPSETEQFVPRFAAALEAYRQVPEDGANLSIIWVPPATDLRVLAAGCSIHPDSIVSLNRAYLRERTPSYGDGWDLVVPQPIARQAFTEAWQMDGSVYTVREGDTWGSIASSLNVTESSLVAANPGTLIEPGARLALPEPDEIPVNASTGDAEGWFYYTVRSGDTLSGIGASVGVGSSEVATWNDISRTSTIYPGQRLVLRGSPAGGTGTPAPSPSPSPGGASVTHTVVSGDTLWDLAGRYGVTVEQIQQLNSLEGSSLRIGQILVISAE